VEVPLTELCLRAAWTAIFILKPYEYVLKLTVS